VCIFHHLVNSFSPGFPSTVILCLNIVGCYRHWRHARILRLHRSGSSPSACPTAPSLLRYPPSAHGCQWARTPPVSTMPVARGRKRVWFPLSVIGQCWFYTGQGMCWPVLRICRQHTKQSITLRKFVEIGREHPSMYMCGICRGPVAAMCKALSHDTPEAWLLSPIFYYQLRPVGQATSPLTSVARVHTSVR
jgi:hypothetical protein